jgi:hypothetical protein
VNISDTDRIEQAIDVASQYGMIDGAHHKQWVIDQMIRTLLGDQYQVWRTEYDAAVDDEGNEYDPWDEGIAP